MTPVTPGVPFVVGDPLVLVAFSCKGRGLCPSCGGRCRQRWRVVARRAVSGGRERLQPPRGADHSGRAARAAGTGLSPLLRPPVAADRLQVTGDGQVRLSLRHPWRDGTTVLVFDPVAFLGRLAVLVPRPRVNLVLHYGVLGARAAWRRDVVAGARRTAADADGPAGRKTEPERVIGT